MVWDKVRVQSFQHICEETVLSRCVFPSRALVKASGQWCVALFLVLYSVPLSLFLCQDHTVLRTIALQYSVT